MSFDLQWCWEDEGNWGREVEAQSANQNACLQGRKVGDESNICSLRTLNELRDLRIRGSQLNLRGDEWSRAKKKFASLLLRLL